MKQTGITRPIDNLGRIVIPKELRSSLEWNVGDNIEIFTSGDKVVLRKFQPADVFTGETEELIEYEGKKVSKNSVRELAKRAGFTIIAEKNEFDVDSDIDDL
ncbi:MAG: AbrB/MazE/SpoVT family DNA-binding domain-containing protein [Firmicutes bacterium]|nr:AbrB/MazE/SpoVT family DNA-binding domain-containing protein [Bacillota bacterium]